MGNYQHLYQELVHKLRAVRRKEVLLSFSAGLLWFISIALFLLTVVTAVEALAFAGVVGRSILFFAWAAVSLAAFAWFALPPLLRVLGIKEKMLEDEIAMRVGKKYPDVEDRLTNALQLYRISSQPIGMSEELALATFGSVGERARSLDFSVIINREEQKRGLLVFLLAISIATIGFGVFSTSMSSALYRLRHFNESFIPPAPFALAIEPHEAQVLRGASTAIVVRATGKFPYDYVTLHVREEQQEEFDAYTVRPDSAGDFRFEMPAIKRGVEFYADVPWYTASVRSEHGRITVLDKPDIRSLSGTVTAPQYTRLAARTIDENSADIVALRGSVVRLDIISNKDLRSADIVLLKKSGVLSLANAGDSAQSTTLTEHIDTVVVPMSIEGRRANGSFSVQHNGEYFIRITDTNGQSNGEPIRYSVAMLSDGLPTIALIEPSTDVELGENAILPVRVVITDDYGFSSLKLKYRLVESQFAEPEENYTSINISLPSAVLAAEVPYVWDVNKIGISPQDKYEFYIEVTDNDAVGGPKSARTGVLALRLPSLDEIFEKAEQTQEVAQKELQQILKEAEEVKKDLDEVARELRKQQQKNKLDWKEQKKIEDVLKKQEEFREKMDEVRQQLAEMTEQLKENQAVSPETLQKYAELQELMKKVDAPELRQRQQQMQKALEQMSPQQMEQAIKDFKFDEENFRKSIERTMKILQRTQAEQKTDELAKRAQELQEKQSEIQKEMANTNPNDKKKMDELAKKQQQLQEELDKLNKELKDLEELMKKIGEDMPMDEMQKAMEELQKEQTEQAMQQAQQEMQKGDMEKAQQQQQKAQQNLKNFAQQMQKMKKQMQKKSTQEAIRQMRKSVQDMIALSKQQEEMKEDAKSMDYNSAQFREQAQKQAEALQDLNNIANNMMQLSQKSFSVTPEMGKEVGDAMRQMQQAMEQLTNRNAQGASKAQGEAMGSMNRSIMQMQQALSRMQGQGQGQGQGEGEGEGKGQGQGGQSFMQRLQQMAMQQQMLNQGMQQMMQQGGQMSPQQSEELGRMAGQQSRLQKSMEQLAKEQKESGGEKKALGDLERLASEMQEIVTDMRTGKIDAETVQRQERILSRLLDATRSTRERDYEKQRESQSGVNTARQSPRELDLDTQEGRNKALQDLLRSIQQGYTKDYEAIIRRYFEALQQTGGGQ